MAIHSAFHEDEREIAVRKQGLSSKCNCKPKCTRLSITGSCRIQKEEYLLFADYHFLWRMKSVSRF